MSNNEISIVGIENTEQNDFIVEICLKSIEPSSECSENELKIVYTLFDKHNTTAHKSTENNKHFLIDETISIKIKSSLSDLIAYFRKIFNLPVELLAADKLLGEHQTQKKKNLI